MVKMQGDSLSQTTEIPGTFAATRIDQGVVANLQVDGFAPLLPRSRIFKSAMNQPKKATKQMPYHHLNPSSVPRPRSDVGLNFGFKHLPKPVLCQVGFSALRAGMDHGCIAYLGVFGA